MERFVGKSVDYGGGADGSKLQKEDADETFELLEARAAAYRSFVRWVLGHPLLCESAARVGGESVCVVLS